MGTKARKTAYQYKAEPALIASIAHWDRLATGKQKPGEGTGGRDCACCKAFSRGGCGNCPVNLRSRFSGCIGTPWEATLASVKGSERFKKAAAKEVDFLKETLRLVQLGKIKP